MSQQRKQVFLDISLWSHQWFDDLPIEYQMCYLLLWAGSDNVGVWRPHFRELDFKLKQSIDPDEFLAQINSDGNRIEVLDNGDWWLVDYLPLQVRTLTPNNRPHVSYIEELRSHGLLTRYAIRNPENVKFEVIYELEDWEEIESIDERNKARKAFLYLQKRGLVRPLQEACETLVRVWQGSKEKDKEEEQEQEEDKDQEQNLIPNYDSSLKKNGTDLNRQKIFGEPSLPNKAPF